MKYASNNDFKKATVGHPFLECCGTCGNETGTIALKKSGRGPTNKDWNIPRHLVNPEAQCEFCQFLGMFFASEKIDPKKDGTKWGAAKLVTQDEKGVRELLAYVPFSDKEDREASVGDDKVELRHGMVIRCVKDGKGASLVEVVEKGV